MTDWRTYRFMFWTLVFAALSAVPFYAWIYDESWGWARGFPLSWMAAGMTTFITFFHEIGHTLFGWFYGYVTLPAFDFQHGGGMAWMMTDQLLPLQLCLYGLLIYAIYCAREYRGVQIMLGLLILFHMATAYTPFHMTVINFMGPGFVVLTASFFLYRAWLDLAPRGALERFLNGYFGFAMVIYTLVDGWALIHSKAARLVYYEQKGQHGFGDFDKTANALHAGFESVVWVWLALAVLGLLLPWLAFCMDRSRI